MRRRYRISKSTPSIPDAESGRFESKAKLNSEKSKGASKNSSLSHNGTCSGLIGIHGGHSLLRDDEFVLILAHLF